MFVKYIKKKSKNKEMLNNNLKNKIWTTLQEKEYEIKIPINRRL